MESIRRNGEESPVARVRRETGTNLNAERAEQVRDKAGVVALTVIGIYFRGANMALGFTL